MTSVNASEGNSFDAAAVFHPHHMSHSDLMSAGRGLAAGAWTLPEQLAVCREHPDGEIIPILNVRSDLARQDLVEGD
jgi:hypothetical protein